MQQLFHYISDLQTLNKWCKKTFTLFYGLVILYQMREMQQQQQPKPYHQCSSVECGQLQQLECWRTAIAGLRAAHPTHQTTACHHTQSLIHQLMWRQTQTSRPTAKITALALQHHVSSSTLMTATISQLLAQRPGTLFRISSRIQ